MLSSYWHNKVNASYRGGGIILPQLVVDITITIEADGDNALQLLELLQGTSLPVETTVTQPVTKLPPQTQAKTPSKVSIKRNMWTKKEEEELVRMWQSGKTSPQCAKVLNRSKKGTANRLCLLRKKLGKGAVRMGKQGRHLQKTTKTSKRRPARRPLPGPKWTLTETQTLIRMRKAGKSQSEIGKKLKRSETAVKSRVQLLIRKGKLLSQQ